MLSRTDFSRRLKFEALQPRLVLDAAMGGDLPDCDPAAQAEVGPGDPAVVLVVEYEGVDGEAKDLAHGGQVDVLSWSWGMSQSGSFHVGGGGGAGFHVGGGGGSGKAGFHDFVLSKYVDKASTPLMPVDDDGSVDSNLVSRLMEQDGADDSFQHEDGKHHVDAALLGAVT